MSIVESKRKLKPCPFCGGDARLLHHQTSTLEDKYTAECSGDFPDCFLTPFRDECRWRYKQEAIEVWNTRTDCLLSFKNLDEVE